MWELAGYDPRYARALHRDADPDEVFKPRLQLLHDSDAPAALRTASVLAWTHLRERDRRVMQKMADRGFIDHASRAEAGPLEEMQYQEELEVARRRVEERHARRLEQGFSPEYANVMRDRELQEAAERIHVQPPAAPDVVDAPRGLPRFARVLAGFAIAGVVVALCWFATWLAAAVGVPGPIGSVFAQVPWLAAAGSVVLFVVAWRQAAKFLRPVERRPERWDSFLPADVMPLYGFYADPRRDSRGGWPVAAWAATMLAVLVGFPVWVTALYVPVSVGVLMAVPPVRRFVVAVSRGHSPATGSRAGRNRLLPLTSTIQSLGPVTSATLPGRVRTGHGAGSLVEAREPLDLLADHAGVSGSTFPSDVSTVAGIVLVDVVSAATGYVDLRLVGACGTGPVHLVSKAVAFGVGSEVLVDVPVDTSPAGPGVADWWRGEADAYKAFAGGFLSPTEASVALMNVAAIIEESRIYDHPDLVRARLETLLYAVRCAAAELAAASASSCGSAS